MKKISVLIPCYNERENIVPLSEALTKIMENDLKNYDYEVVFIDNNSQDGTKNLLEKICLENSRIKAIFNAKNFGLFNSSYYGMLQTTGDCTILLYCDFQEPLELIPDMVKEWGGGGSKIVVMQKTRSEENKIIYFLRSCYYKLLKNFSDVEQIEHFTGFGLYDKSFINILRELKDPTPFLRGIVAELGYKIKIIQYTQAKRRAGKSHFNFFAMYDLAMLGFTTYTKFGLRAATLLGFITAFTSMLIAMFYLVMKLIFPESFAVGIAPIVTGMFFLGSVILIFLGLMGEYIISINHRLINRPLVIEESRINF